MDNLALDTIKPFERSVDYLLSINYILILSNYTYLIILSINYISGIFIYKEAQEIGII